MLLSFLRRKLYFIVLVGILALTLLAACSSATSTASTTSSTNAPTSAPTQPATATATALKQMITLVGQPAAKMLSGTTFEVDGMVKNGDSKQHDIYLLVTLLDASGAKIATTAPKNVDNVAGGATVAYTIQGTTTQPTWASVQVAIVKITENLGSSGSD